MKPPVQNKVFQKIFQNKEMPKQYKLQVYKSGASMPEGLYCLLKNMHKIHFFGNKHI